ncbi:MAG: methylated-DNA--[protein]-cysteine S-methyltransferase [bacterium]|nr:methylated-DNA--[protein]-cysteine S-methyltransferase [bacterium]
MTEQRSTDYARVERAIGFLAERVEEQPKLAEVANAVGLSGNRTQRLFKRWAGVSPKRFLEFLTVEHAKHLLDRSINVLDTSLAVGLSGPGRLHDHFVKLEAMSPGEYKSGGHGLELVFGVHASPFGRVFLAASGRGICRLAFVDGSERQEITELSRSWPAAAITRDQAHTGELAGRIFEPSDDASEILVRVSGTNFQLAVWKALLGIPRGSLVSYETVANAAGRPGATRAVGSAVAANPVAYLIPCHRVIRKSGVLGNYRWGVTRKQALVAWESARSRFPAA